MRKKKPEPAPFGYYFCEADGRFYIKEFGYIPGVGYTGTCWFQSMDDGTMLPFSISFDDRYHNGFLEFLGDL